MPVAVASALHEDWTSAEAAISACVQSAPIFNEPLLLMLPRPSIRLMSINRGASLRRSFMAGNRLWPPASNFASSLSDSNWSASATDDGRA